MSRLLRSRLLMSRLLVSRLLMSRLLTSRLFHAFIAFAPNYHMSRLKSVAVIYVAVNSGRGY
jgi:hypothetical protein